jgi:hypothetical protein
MNEELKSTLCWSVGLVAYFSAIWWFAGLIHNHVFGG